MSDQEWRQEFEQRFRNLLSIWIMTIERDLPDSGPCRKAFTEWVISVEMLMKYVESDQAAQSMKEHAEALHEAVLMWKSATA